jgi:hypothetical protein
VVCWRISGNLQSRFTEFLTGDGEKPWRKREEEFEARTVTRAALLSKWGQGWDALLGTLTTLTDEQLQLTVTIRRQPLLVHEALHRSLAHLSDGGHGTPCPYAVRTINVLPGRHGLRGSSPVVL